MSERSKGNSRTTRLGTATLRDRIFSVQIKLQATGEVFPLKRVHNDMKISELKNLAEYATGIPVGMQRLYYLDEGDLLQSSDVRSCDIVPGGVLNMTVWSMWRTLVEAVATNDIEWVFQLGVTEDTDYKTPTSEYMSPQMKKDWLADRAFIALYIAAHRGHMKLCKKLLDSGANVNGRTSLGHTPLHVASAQGHGHMVDLLLENGADIDAVDKAGENALAAACRFDHKDCERHLFLFRWQQRAKHMKPQEMRELFAHQFHDSINPVWLKGGQAQIYYTQILPPGEFQGTGFSAPRRRVGSAQSSSPDQSSICPSNMSDSDDDSDETSSADSTRGRRRGGDSLPVIQDKQSLTSSEVRQKRKKAKKKALEYGRKRSEHPKGYEDWLARKQAVEQVKVDKRKQQEAAHKLAEEDKKRQQDFQDKSYEQWLADKETKKSGPAAHAPPPTTGVSTTKKPVAHVHLTQSQVASNTNKNLIKTVIRRKEQEMARQGVLTFDQWLNQTEGQILDQIRAGRTPLQRMIQQVSQ